MNYPPDILNPDSLAGVLKQSCATAVVVDPQGAGSIERLGALVELLVMYIPLDQYGKVLDEWAAQPEGKRLHEAVREVVNGCGHCEELRVVGPDHRNTRDTSHDEGCVVDDLLGRVMEQPGFAAAVDRIRGKKPIR